MPVACGGPLKILEGLKGWDEHLQERYYRINIYSKDILGQTFTGIHGIHLHGLVQCLNCGGTE